MLERIPALLFRGFQKALELQAIDTSHRDLTESEEGTQRPHGHLNDEELMRAALNAGEVYRGVGVLVGLLGALVVLLALLPDAFRISGHVKTTVSYLKLCLVIIVVGLVIAVKASRLHSRWIQLRLLAESRRYAGLEVALQEARGRGAKELEQLRQHLLETLDGPKCQNTYNEGRAHTYEGIEAFVKRTTYVGFGFSMTAAFASVALSNLNSKVLLLLLFTALVPVAAATLHGIVGFLRLPELVVQHERMAARLCHWLKRVPPRLSQSGAKDRLCKAAEGALTDLRQGDIVWTTVVRKAEVMPA